MRMVQTHPDADASYFIPGAADLVKMLRNLASTDGEYMVPNIATQTQAVSHLSNIHVFSCLDETTD